MQNEKPFYFRIIAIFCAFLLCIGLAVSCFLFVPGKVHATSQDAQIVYDAVTNLALETFTDPGLSTEEMAVISAQAAIAYWYAAISDASTWTSGQGRIFSGYCVDGDNNMYFGSAVINDDASTMYGHLSDSNNNSISVSYTLADRTNLPYTRTMVPNEGFGASGGQRYTISTNSTYVYAWQYDGEFSGDPFEGWFIIGSSPLLRDARFKRPSPNNCGMLFYSGGLNLTGTDITPTGDFSADFAELKTTLQEDYPDVDPEYFLPDPAVDVPTSDTSDTTDSCGCHCTHEIIVNVEPTIIVEPTINVYVTENINIDNNFEVPSDWLEDYTAPTEETIPSFSNPSETMPSMDMEDIDSNYGDGVRFWFWLAKTFIDDSDLGLIVKFSFIMVVSGFIIWRLGGGKKGD